MFLGSGSAAVIAAPVGDFLLSVGVGWVGHTTLSEVRHDGLPPRYLLHTSAGNDLKLLAAVELLEISRLSDSDRLFILTLT